MRVTFPELEQARITVSPGVRAAHIASIDTAIRQWRAPRRRRLRLMALAMTLVLVVPVVALAAEDAVPGDILYPLKRALEPVVELFDSDVVAERRIDEAEALLSRGASTDVVRHQVDQAREAVAGHRDDIARRIEAVDHELSLRDVDGVGEDRRTADDPPADSRPADGLDEGEVHEETPPVTEVEGRPSPSTTHPVTDSTRPRDRG